MVVNGLANRISYERGAFSRPLQAKLRWLLHGCCQRSQPWCWLLWHSTYLGLTVGSPHGSLQPAMQSRVSSGEGSVLCDLSGAGYNPDPA